MNTRRPLLTLVALGLSLTLAACGHRYAMGPGPAGAGGPGASAGAPGCWGMGPGMMGGAMGPGMMGGGMGMGMGMMGGPGMGLGQLDLSAEQRTRIAEIQADVGRRQSTLMNAMHAQGGPMHGGGLDEAGERRAYEAMSAGHKQMFELHLEARKRVMAVLTPAQREQLTRGAPGR